MDSASHTITTVTQSPARACSATVPPHPSNSSSGCAAITSTRLFTAPHLARPVQVGERRAMPGAPVLVLELEQHDGTLAAGDGLSACCSHRTHDGTDDLAGSRRECHARGKAG